MTPEQNAKVIEFMEREFGVKPRGDWIGEEFAIRLFSDSDNEDDANAEIYQAQYSGDRLVEIYHYEKTLKLASPFTPPKK